MKSGSLLRAIIGIRRKLAAMTPFRVKYASLVISLIIYTATRDLAAEIELARKIFGKLFGKVKVFGLIEAPRIIAIVRSAIRKLVIDASENMKNPSTIVMIELMF